MRRVADRGLDERRATARRRDRAALRRRELRRRRADRGPRRDPRPGRRPARDRAGAASRAGGSSSASSSATRTTRRRARCAAAARPPACAGSGATGRRSATSRGWSPELRFRARAPGSCTRHAAPAPCRLLLRRDPEGRPRARVQLRGGRRDDDRRPRGDRPDPRARHPAGVEGRLDLPPPQRPHPGDRGRRGRAQAVPLPPAVARRPRPGQVRRDGAVRALAAADARAHREPTSPAAGWCASGSSPARCACSTSGFFRIGSERYTEENETFGLATLRRSHVTIAGGVASFHYKAKGAKDHHQEIADPVLVPTLRKLKDRDGGGYELLAYREGRSGWADVKAAEINEYLKEVTGGDYSAKDFRTWNATVLAAVDLADQRRRGDRRERPQARGDARRPSASPRTSRTPRPSAARPTSTRASSTATTAARRSAARCGGWSPAPTRASSSTASASSAPCCA